MVRALAVQELGEKLEHELLLEDFLGLPPIVSISCPKHFDYNDPDLRSSSTRPVAFVGCDDGGQELGIVQAVGCCKWYFLISESSVGCFAGRLL